MYRLSVEGKRESESGKEVVQEFSASKSGDEENVEDGVRVQLR